MAEDAEGAFPLERYEAVVNGVRTLLKLTPTRAKQMGLRKTSPRTRTAGPSAAEDAATEVASTAAEHKKRTVRAAGGDA